MRVKRALIRRTRKRKVFKLAKGFVGRKKNVWRTAVEAVHHAMAYSYRHRRTRKRDFRRLWIVRVNAAARQHGISYSRLMHGLKRANVILDRKVLAHLAVSDPEAFGAVVEAARSQLA